MVLRHPLLRTPGVQHNEPTGIYTAPICLQLLLSVITSVSVHTPFVYGYVTLSPTLSRERTYNNHCNARTTIQITPCAIIFNFAHLNTNWPRCISMQYAKRTQRMGFFLPEMAELQNIHITIIIFPEWTRNLHCLTYNGNILK